MTYKTRPNEYCYSNSVTGKDVRVRERPTEPPPMGLDLLRKPDNASGWFGVSMVGRKKDKYQAKWWCHELKTQRALPGLHDSAEDAAAELYEFIETGAAFDEPVAERKYARGTKPPPKKKAKLPRADSTAADASDTLGQENSGSKVLPSRVEDVLNPTMRIFLRRAAAQRLRLCILPPLLPSWHWMAPARCFLLLWILLTEDCYWLVGRGLRRSVSVLCLCCVLLL